MFHQLDNSRFLKFFFGNVCILLEIPRNCAEQKWQWCDQTANKTTQLQNFNSLFLLVRFSVTKLGNDGHGAYFFLVDEERFAFEDEWNTGDESTSGSCTINMELTAGQTVRIENWQSTGIYGTDSDGYVKTWFTGYLIFARSCSNSLFPTQGLHPHIIFFGFRCFFARYQ